MVVTAWSEDVLQHAAVLFAAIEKIGASGEVWVSVPGRGPARASVLRSVSGESLRDALAHGDRVAVLPAGERASRPVIIGVVDDRIAGPAAAAAESGIDAHVDGRHVVLTGKEQVTLRCGKASITLTKAGKILLRGAYLLSRSSGVNRIKGGSVQIN